MKLDYTVLVIFSLSIAPISAIAFGWQDSVQVCNGGDPALVFFVDSDASVTYSYDSGPIVCQDGTGRSIQSIDLSTATMATETVATGTTTVGGSLRMDDELTFAIAGGGSRDVTVNMTISGQAFGPFAPGAMTHNLTFGASTDQVSLQNFAGQIVLSVTQAVSDGETLFVAGDLASKVTFGGPGVDLVGVLSVDLPADTSFTSASGVFPQPAQAVPSANIWGLGFLAVLLTSVAAYDFRIRVRMARQNSRSTHFG